MKSISVSRKAFWDVRYEELDFEKSSLYIMEKVFNYGTWDDQIKIMRYYGLPRIRKEIINASFLGKTVLSFLCIILHLTKTDFVCYNRKQLNPLPWNY